MRTTNRRMILHPDWKLCSRSGERWISNYFKIPCVRDTRTGRKGVRKNNRSTKNFIHWDSRGMKPEYNQGDINVSGYNDYLSPVELYQSHYNPIAQRFRPGVEVSPVNSEWRRIVTSNFSFAEMHVVCFLFFFRLFDYLFRNFLLSRIVLWWLIKKGKFFINKISYYSIFSLTSSTDWTEKSHYWISTGKRLKKNLRIKKRRTGQRETGHIRSSQGYNDLKGNKGGGMVSRGTFGVALSMVLIDDAVLQIHWILLLSFREGFSLSVLLF